MQPPRLLPGWSSLPFGNLRHEASLQVLRGLVAPGEIGRCLDVGCGSGQFLERVQREIRPVRAVGLDTQVATNRELGPSAVFLRGDAGHLPFLDGCMDLVVILETLEHVHDPEAVLADCRRVLRPSGIIVASTPNRRSITAATGRFVARIRGKQWVAWDPTHVRLYAADEFVETLTRAGFQIVRAAGFWLFPESVETIMPDWIRRIPRIDSLLSAALVSEAGLRRGFITIVVGRKTPG